MTRTASILVIVQILVVMWVVSPGAQFSYKTGIDVAGFTVTVVDRTGETVRGLTADDFEVREDGVPQSVHYFVAGSGVDAVPLHIGLLFDTSESMEKDLAFSRNAAIRFLRTFSEAEDFTLVEFADDIRAARYAQSEFARLVERIRSGKAKGKTSLYDAVSVYLGSAFDQTGKKVLVIFTDGDDTSSSRRWDEVVRLLRASDVTVYPIGFVSHRGSPRLTLQSRLQDIARLSGGRAVFPATMKELDPMYAEIAAEIQGQYVLGYVPTNSARDGKWRKVEIKVTRRGSEQLQLRTRQGYFAPVNR